VTGPRRMRIVVCGTTFGRIYLDALALPDAPFELAGILARGSERSQRCADERRVPLYTAPDQIPDDIDAAGVVVRSGLLGGPGTDLAAQLLERGLHVIQEHPVHQDELARCLRLAARRGVQYHLNTFYEHLGPVRRFHAAAAALVRVQRPLFVDATAGFPVAFALLDLIGRTLGGVRPWSFGPLAPLTDDAGSADAPGRLRVLDGRVAGVPVTLRVQHQLDPVEPDNPAHLLHGISLGVEGGTLHLVTTHGPIVWTPRPWLPGGRATSASADEAPAATIIGPTDVPGFGRAVATVWPAAARRALEDLRQAIVDHDDPMRRGQYQLSLCGAWHDLAGRLGPPELTPLARGRNLSTVELATVVAAGAAAGDR